MRLFLLFLCLSFLCGCFSSARSLDELALTKIIEKGTTTRGQIEKHLGKPAETYVGPNGKTVVNYYLVKGSATPQLRAYVRNVSLLYNANGVVENWIHHESTKTIDRKGQATKVGIEPLHVNGMIRRGMAAGNLVLWYGSPDFKTITAEGDFVYGWFYANKEKEDVATKSERLLVLVDPQGSVKDFRIQEAMQYRP